MGDSLEERPAYCVICGRELDDGDKFVIFINPEVVEQEDGAVVASAVLIGECCGDAMQERGEAFDYLAMLELFGQLGCEC